MSDMDQAVGCGLTEHGVGDMHLLTLLIQRRPPYRIQTDAS